MPSNADIGFGATVTFQSGFVAQARNITWGGLMRGSFDTSHNAVTSGYRTFLPGDLKDPGTLTIEVLHDPDDNILAALAAAPETVTLTWPVPAGGTVAATWACSGFMTKYDPVNCPMDDVLTATIEIKFTGLPVFTDGS